MCQLVVAGDGEFERNSKALDAHDGDRADQAADGDVYQWITGAVDRCDAVYHP